MFNKQSRRQLVKTIFAIVSVWSSRTLIFVSFISNLIFSQNKQPRKQPNLTTKNNEKRSDCDKKCPWLSVNPSNGWLEKRGIGQPGSGNDCNGERKRVFDDFIDILVDDPRVSQTRGQTGRYTTDVDLKLYLFRGRKSKSEGRNEMPRWLSERKSDRNNADETLERGREKTVQHQNVASFSFNWICKTLRF